MASSKADTSTPAEPAKVDADRAVTDQDVKEPLLSKRASGQLAAVPIPRGSNSGLPAFHLPPEGLGGIRLAAVWVT